MRLPRWSKAAGVSCMASFSCVVAGRVFRLIANALCNAGVPMFLRHQVPSGATNCEKRSPAGAELLIRGGENLPARFCVDIVVAVRVLQVLLFLFVAGR